MGSIPVIRKVHKNQLDLEGSPEIFEEFILISSLGEMVNTADLKSAPLRVIGSIPIVSRTGITKRLQSALKV